MSLLTLTTTDLMCQQFTQLNEARSLLESEIKQRDPKASADEQWATVAENDLVYAKMAGIEVAQKIIFNTWEDFSNAKP